MIVRRIVREKDRTLLYANLTALNGKPEYHVIANADCKVQVGDVILCEPYGFNFGWLIETHQRGAI